MSHISAWKALVDCWKSPALGGGPRNIQTTCEMRAGKDRPGITTPINGSPLPFSGSLSSFPPPCPIPLPASVKEYYQYQRPSPSRQRASAHPHAPPPPPARPDGHPPLDGPPSSSGSSEDPNADAAVDALYAAQPRTLAAAQDRARPADRVRSILHVREGAAVFGGRVRRRARGLPPVLVRGARAAAAGVVPRECVQGGGAGARPSVGSLEVLTRGIVLAEDGEPRAHSDTAIRVQGGEAHLLGYQGTYFDSDGAWETTINKFASALPPLTVPINGRDEPRVVFDTLPLLEGARTSLNKRNAPTDIKTPITIPFFYPNASGFRMHLTPTEPSELRAAKASGRRPFILIALFPRLSAFPI
ncbi:hypothetical protein B0H17DRAFT_1179970 [Mycena rosella]|uniref:Uncharacterized protein n=1 Tax=Mycena rosella TaxID=1033263 RepID=A0AAD7DF84_MYCRO|nr:hypothetical protein B0H17DRAFT_1179970 [Mycena rosella]